MILVSRKSLFLFTAVALIICLSSGILGYLWLGSPQAARIDTKLAAERILYITIVGAIILILLASHLYMNRIRIERKLRRISSLGGTASPTHQLQSAELGSLGKTLEVLYRRILEVNEKQSLKLSGQSELISLLIAGSDAPIAVTDVTGRILYMSNKYEKRTGEVRSKLIGASIETFEKEMVVPLVIRELEHYRSYSTEKKEIEQTNKHSYTVLPIFNKLGTISYLLFDFRADSPFGSLKRNKGPGRGEKAGAEGVAGRHSHGVQGSPGKWFGRSLLGNRNGKK